MASNPVTDEHAKKFEQYLRRWQGRLNLGDWRINLSPTRTKTAMAVVYKMDFEQRQASIRLGTDFGADAPTDEMLEATALHELLHVAFCELLELSKETTLQGDALRSAEHRLINTFERLLVLEKGRDVRPDSKH